MADIIYTVNQDSPENIEGFEQYSQEDRALVSSFQINNTFNPTKNYSELHILSLSDELLESDYNYVRYKQAAASQAAGQDGTSALTIDPIEDSKAYGYTNGGTKLLYHFLDDLYSQDRTEVQFYIQDISVDRTEISLATLSIQPDDLVNITSAIKTKLQSQSYFTGFRLNLKENDLLIATNIDTLDSPTGKVVVVKLYEPLPDRYKVKSTLNIVDLVSDSIAYEIEVEFILPPELTPTLRSPNFNIDIADNSVIPTGYYNYNELFSYPINNSNSQLFSAVSEKGIDISIDYSDFSNFVHFSSAQERLLNFKYKLDLVNNYSSSLSTISTSTTGLQGVSGSRDYYQNLLTGIVNNFDHYERYLYFESGSNSWPKSNTTKPYSNKASNAAEAITWYTNEIANAISFDNTNYNSLAYSIPTYLRDDPNNENYLTFVYMVGQHFDNLWLYSKAVTDKYDADNRINYGISKDLVAEALENFGVKLYTSNKSIEDLFTTFIGQAYQSGSEKVTNYITGSLTGSNTPIQPVSYDNYQKEVQKRIYHNLPLLLKSKGTERGLRALINCLGIPSDILKIKLYGGRNRNERPFYGDYRFYTSSLDKIRLDNTGSIVSGSTLSNYVSIIKRDDKYTDDLHPIEVGFSPTDNVDNYIISKSLATASLANFNIDDYIGDPRNLTSDIYYAYSPAGSAQNNLTQLTNQIMSGSTAYNVQDYVRLIKFYDNTIFKMVKDYIPARAVADTGIIIKPHVLSRSKAKSVILSGSRPEYSGSIDTAFIAGGNAGIFNGIENKRATEYSTAYTDIIQTPTGLQSLPNLHGQEQPKVNGEFNGSGIQVTNGNLTANNPYLQASTNSYPFNIVAVSTPVDVCLLTANNVPFVISSLTPGLPLYQVGDFFNFSGGSTFTVSASSIGVIPITFPHAFGNDGLSQYQTITVTGTNPNIAGCTASSSAVWGVCYLGINTHPNNVVRNQITPYNLTQWFSIGAIPTSNLEYTITWDTGTQTLTYQQAQQYVFTQDIGTVLTIGVRDTGLGQACKTSFQISIGNSNLGTIDTGSAANGGGCAGLQFTYSYDTVPQGTTDEYLSGGGYEPSVEIQSTLGFTNDVDPYGNAPIIQPVSAPNIKGKGLAGFFTPFNDPIGTVGIGPTTRYAVFELTNTFNNNTIRQNVGGWKIQLGSTSPDWMQNNRMPNPCHRNINPYGLSDPGPEDDPLCYATNITYPIQGPVPNPPYVPTIGGNSFNYPLPLDYTSPRSLGFPSGYWPPEPYTWARAMVIQAYSSASPETTKQVVLYGQKEVLAITNTTTPIPLEGLPKTGVRNVTNSCPRFIDVWLKENFQYGANNLVESSQTSIYSKGTSADAVGARWFKIPIRYWTANANPSQTEINAAITAVVGHQYPPQ